VTEREKEVEREEIKAGEEEETRRIKGERR